MFGRSYFIYLISILATLQLTVAQEFYKEDVRAPDQMKMAGGITSRNPQGTNSIVDHVRVKNELNDPWVSTTTSIFVAADPQVVNPKPNTYIYYVDLSGLNAVDVNAEYQAQMNQQNPHAYEDEFVVRGIIPWSAIIKWDRYQNGQRTETQTREDFD
jgi:hypothetical protein